MLIYATCLQFTPSTKIEGVLNAVAPWFGKKIGLFFTGTSFLADGKWKKKATLVEIISSVDSFPQLVSIRLTHPDEIVSGRQWLVELGVKHESENEPVIATILLKTSEISALVTAQVQPTRPLFVDTLIKKCAPSPETIGVHTKTLDETSATLFLTSLEDQARDYPFVVISPTADGTYLVNIDKLISLLYGICEIVIIPPTSNTYEIARIIGKENAAWRGAINLVMPKRRFEGTILTDTHRIMPDDLSKEDGTPEGAVFLAVTHRTNLPLSWRHISQEHVRQQRLRREISITLTKLKSNTNCKDCDYVKLLSDADEEIIQSNKETEQLIEDINYRDGIIRGLQTKNNNLTAALSGKQSSSNEADTFVGIIATREAIGRNQNDRASVEDTLRIISFLFSDRIVVLDSAFTSAKKSKDFKFTQKVYELLWILATEYWAKMKAGVGDTEARKVFGTSYAAHEKETLSSDGKKRRTFSHEGEQILMEKHLKVGVKESDSETLRVHFVWESDDQKVIIGYCGPHIPF